LTQLNTLAILKPLAITPHKSPPPSKEQERNQPQPTNRKRIARAKPKTTNPTTKAKTTKEREPMQETKKTGYSVQENRNPKK
jgi:hypothetical protein